jgi:hypothetical protein
MKIKIKPWKTLEKEFGLDKDGDINSPIVFTRDMEKQLPADRVISVVPTQGLYIYKIVNRVRVVHATVIEEIVEGLNFKLLCKYC